ncbi:MAG: GNAT family N-acetyltransferase [Verrucomicrobiota bacterium]
MNTEANATHYKSGKDLDLDAVIGLYRASTLGERRPVDDRERMARMIAEANLVLTAWDGDLLVGISRSFSDFSFVTYLADLAVRKSHQRRGIGKELIRRTQSAAGPNALLVLLAAPAAEQYYPHIGFTHHPQAWTLKPEEAVID